MLIGALAFSFMLIPLGYYFMIEGEIYIIGEATVIIGFILFAVTVFKIIREENRKNKEDKQRFDSLMTEVRGLRQDLRNGGDDSGRDNNTTK